MDVKGERRRSVSASLPLLLTTVEDPVEVDVAQRGPSTMPLGADDRRDYARLDSALADVPVDTYRVA